VNVKNSRPCDFCDFSQAHEKSRISQLRANLDIGGTLDFLLVFSAHVKAESPGIIAPHQSLTLWCVQVKCVIAIDSKIRNTLIGSTKGKYCINSFYFSGHTGLTKIRRRSPREDDEKAPF